MTNSSVWFRNNRSNKQGGLKLFCFPYAGGTASIYQDWAKFLPPSIEVIAVELPGRGTRLKELPFVSLPALIDALTESFLPFLSAQFAFFGHSMGAVIAFELARRLRREHDQEPQLLLVSGRRAPQISSNELITYDLPKDKFIGELYRLEGTPKEVLEHAELMDVITPILRADFQLIQTYKYVDADPLCCPITAFGGLQDSEETQELLSLWKEQTSSNFTLYMLPGDHFFIRSSQPHLLGLLARELIEISPHARNKDD